MKPLIAALLLALVAAPAMAGDVVDTSFVKAEGAHAFNVRDLVMMDRVSDPQLSPDGRYAAFGVRSTDYDANKGVSAVYVLDLAKDGQPVKVVDKGSSARWSADGRSLYFVAPAKGVAQLWRVDLGGEGGLNLAEHAPAVQVSHGVLDVGGYKLSPDGKQVLLSYEVYADCTTLACTQQRIDARAKDKASGTLYDKLFVRHWDTWADGRRNQLFVARFDGKGQLAGEPKRLSRGIDGDVPSKPFGDESEFGFAPDGKTVYFNARIAGTSEPWSTNFDVYSVPADGLAAPKTLTAENKAWDAYPVASPDGKTLYYLAMKTPGFEADRFAIMALDLASGAKREVDPKWDRSPGGLTISADGKTLYATADDNGQHPLFAIDAASGKVSQLVGEGTVSGFSLAAGKLLLIRDDLKRPADVYLAAADGSSLKQVTHFNAADLKNAKVGDAEFFTFKGWNNETVQGYVVKPVDYQPGKTYPVAFIIHGGPQGAMENGWSYRWNPQTYAGQGFAVVTVNFHGSTGYGQAFTDSISGDWGGKPLEDLKLGWKAALDKYRFLDGDRACALGASYGGYMVYWIAGVWNQP
ncbi:UNVERIFIED_ORG: peptidase S9, partial [Rhodanobacter sp. FW104-R5]